MIFIDIQIIQPPIQYDDIKGFCLNISHIMSPLIMDAPTWSNMAI